MGGGEVEVMESNFSIPIYNFNKFRIVACLVWNG